MQTYKFRIIWGDTRTGYVKPILRIKRNSEMKAWIAAIGYVFDRFQLSKLEQIQLVYYTKMVNNTKLEYKLDCGIWESKKVR